MAAIIAGALAGWVNPDRACAQTLDAGTLERYGGTYASDCRDSRAPRLRVLVDAFVVEDGARRMTARSVHLATTYPAAHPPPGFEPWILGRLASGGSLMLVAVRDPDGAFMALVGDPAVNSALGPLRGVKFRPCERAGAQATRPVSPPAPQRMPAAAAPAPEGTLDAQVVAEYGGTYSPACADQGAPRVRVLADALVAERAGQQTTGRNVESSFSFLGQDPPEEFQVAFLSRLDGGGGSLDLLVFRDKKGQYLTVNDDPSLHALFERKTFSTKFRSCDPPRAKPIAAAPTPPSAASKASPAPPNPPPWALLDDRDFKSAYFHALGARQSERWLARLEGPAEPTRDVVIGGIDYTFGASCKSHECGDNTVVFLYSARRRVAYVETVQARGGKQYLGAPPPEITAALERLWREAFPALR